MRCRRIRPNLSPFNLTTVTKDEALATIAAKAAEAKIAAVAVSEARDKLREATTLPPGTLKALGFVRGQLWKRTKAKYPLHIGEIVVVLSIVGESYISCRALNKQAKPGQTSAFRRNIYPTDLEQWEQAGEYTDEIPSWL